MNVPILDLGRARQRIATQLDERWRRILDETSFILGPEVKEFEAAFASYLGVEACVGLANGTDALVLALRALGLQAGRRGDRPRVQLLRHRRGGRLARRQGRSSSTSIPRP